MKTIFSIVLLIVWSSVASFLSVYILNIAGLPGALLASAGNRDKRRKGQYNFGTIISVLGQSYVYLAFVAFIVNWTRLAARRDDVVGFPLWPFAFLAVLFPITRSLARARQEAKEDGYTNAQVEALEFTQSFSLIGFFVFIFWPMVMKAAWGWVPYMK
jgi:hypothetical protein